MVLSFFVSNIITVLGSMMDSFTVSNTMDEAAVMVKAELINIGISEFNAEAVGLQAYNVTVQVNYFVNALMMSAVAAMFLLAGISAGNIIAVLILPVFVAVINRMGGGKDHLWMFPKGFGVPASDEISAEIRTQEEVVEFSERAWQFCTDKGESARIAYLTSPAASIGERCVFKPAL